MFIRGRLKAGWQRENPLSNSLENLQSACWAFLKQLYLSRNDCGKASGKLFTTDEL